MIGLIKCILEETCMKKAERCKKRSAFLNLNNRGAEGRTRTGTSISSSRDFKSLASTIPPPRHISKELESFTPYHYQKVSRSWRRHPESNRGSRICSPLPYHLAMPPFYQTAFTAPQFWRSYLQDLRILFQDL